MPAHLPIWTVIPFAGILLSIALFPLLHPDFWERRYRWVALLWALGAVVVVSLIRRSAAPHEFALVIFAEYLPFVILLWGLYAVSGGIYIKETLAGTPRINVLLLLIGTMLASVMGTTGASMVMIRPLLRANSARKRKSHVVIFFIFLASNIGGLLTPLGDPPLFLGFLHGVPFFWTLSLLPQFLVTVSLTLAAFLVLDTIYYRRDHGLPETALAYAEKHPIRVEGLQNLGWLAGILGAVMLSGLWDSGKFILMGLELSIAGLVRDGLILAFGWASLKWTPNRIRRENHFDWEPMKEVAWLFFTIFITLVPVVEIIREAGGEFHLGAPWKYFWLSGGLSSFLDNAPTYLLFFNIALSEVGLDPTAVTTALQAATGDDRFVQILKALSCGVVFMGAMTYIGNAPNFLVRSMAKRRHYPMPGFFGYMLWSMVVLLPIFLLINILFFI